MSELTQETGSRCICKQRPRSLTKVLLTAKALRNASISGER